MNPKKYRKMGWICFGLLWVPFGIVMYESTKMPPGDYRFDELSQLMVYSLIMLGVLFALSFAFVFIPFVVARHQKAAIRKTGRPGKARILRLYETGTTINDQPVVGFELEVHPVNGAIFRVTTEQRISRFDFPRIQPGAEIDVKYDLATQKVVIV